MSNRVAQAVSIVDLVRIIVYHRTVTFAARWQSGYAAVCKTVYIGSIPVRASIISSCERVPVCLLRDL